MKKIFTLLMIAMFALGTSAQRKAARLPMQKPAATLMKSMEKKLQRSNIVKLQRNMPLRGLRASKKAPDLITVPDAAETVLYTPTGSRYVYGQSDDWEETDFPISMAVAFDGSDVYIQGLAYYFPDAWVKGNLADGKVTFASGQFVGEDEYGEEYLCGGDANDDTGEVIVDYVFNYDEETGILTLDENSIILETESPTDLAAYAFVETLTLTPGAVEAVTPPEGITADDWTLEARSLGYDDDDNEVYEDISKSLMIAFDGNDVYVQGMCDYLPEAWIKGTRNGNQVTFPNGQYLGSYQTIDWNTFSNVSYTMFFVGIDGEATTDVVFTLNDEENLLTTTNIIGVAESAEGGNIFEWLEDTEITKINVVPGVPATPTIIEATMTGNYPSVKFNIPTTDVDGNNMAPSKISYQLFYDIEEDVNPYVFLASEYEELEEDMETMPYMFTDNWDIVTGEAHIIYLYGDNLKSWNRVGVMSIYTVGDEVNESEVAWYEIKPYGSGVGDKEATFDFNALTEEEQPVSTNTSHDGDITDSQILTEDGIDLTITASGANTANRYWKDYSSGNIQLRLYGGTMTFQSSEDAPIVKIEFYYGKWNEYNEADSGSFDDGSPQTWTGNAPKVVVSIGGNTQLNKIVVTTASSTGISNVETSAQSGGVAVFDLQGRRVSGNAMRGLYVRDGKKVLVK